MSEEVESIDEEAIKLRIAKINYLKEMFGTSLGKEVLETLKKNFHFYNTCYQGDANDTIFREGERNVIIYLNDMLNLDTTNILKDFRKRKQEEEDADY